MRFSLTVSKASIQHRYIGPFSAMTAKKI